MNEESTTRRVVGPFNRVEGDLQITLEIANGKVKNAFVNSPMYRGFEQILHGKNPMDALVYVPRICGICSVAQSAAAAQALAQAMQLQPPKNALYTANLTLAAENLADHISHFYLFFMPDFAREEYRNQPWFEDAQARFKAVTGSASKDVLPARARFMQLMGYLAGKWPHTLTMQPGGSARAIVEAERLRMTMLLAEFRTFLERTLFADKLENVCALETEADLLNWAEPRFKQADFAKFIHYAYQQQLHLVGRAYDRFMSYGAYGQGEDSMFKKGVWDNGLQALDIAAIREDVSHSWMAGAEALAPHKGLTMPQPEKADAYSWCKAPRLNGKPLETGALARQMVDGNLLLHDIVRSHGGSVTARVVARMLEVAKMIPAMQTWLKHIQMGEPFCLPAKPITEGVGIGLVEAARGGLGHWLDARDSKLFNYQIVAPTTWNFSPRDAHGVPGALELALAGLPAQPASGSTPVLVQHVVRSFDPCMVCTVH